MLKDIYFKQYDNLSNQGRDEEYICLTEGVVKFSPRPASHRGRRRSKQASPRPAALQATAPVGGGDGVLSKLLLVLRVDGTHQKYSSV